MIDPVQTAADINTLLAAEEAGVSSIGQQLVLSQEQRDAISRLLPIAKTFVSGPGWTAYVNQLNQWESE